MLLEYFVDILLVDIGVPGPFRVYHQHRALLAAIQTAGSIDPGISRPGYPQRLTALFGVIAHFFSMKTLAAGAVAIALISTEKDVVFVIRHMLLPCC